LYLYLKRIVEIQKEVTELAYKAWLHKPFKETYQNEEGDGFKDFLIEFIDEEFEKECTKNGWTALKAEDQNI
jgi:hypothetical protein